MSKQDTSVEIPEQTEENAEVLSTTAKLFGQTEPQEDVVPVVEESEIEETPVTPEQPISDFIDVGTMGEQKVKTKIDGIDGEVSLSELLKGYQTNQHLSRKGNEIAAERGVVEELRKELMTTAPAVPEASPFEDEDWYNQSIKPYLEPINKKIEGYEELIKGQTNTINQLTEAIRPMYLEQTKMGIDMEMKSKGLDDFIDKWPEVERYILEQPPEDLARYNTTDGIKGVYLNMKALELAKPKTSIPDERPEPATTSVESGSAPSGAGNEDTQIKTLMAKATKSGKTEDWDALIKAKLKSQNL